jgi:nucleoside-diphosphate-sugar epimerase
MKNAFVTGGTGFIGSHLVEELHRRRYGEVRCLIRSDNKWLKDLDVVEIRADLFDVDTIAEAVQDVDYVYHVGGITRARDWPTFERLNVDATIRLVETVARVNPSVKRVIVTSSLAAVGPCDGGVATEDSPLNPITHYGRSKALMERRLGELDGIVPLTVNRPPSVYGPRERDIFTFFKSVSRGICPIVGSSDGPALSLVHVDDVVRGMVDAAESASTAGNTYFVGSETFFSWNDVKHAVTSALDRWALTVAVPPFLIGPVGTAVEMFGNITGTYPPLNREKAREIRHACKMCSIEKAKRHFGYAQHVPLKRGIIETISWYKEMGWL